MSNEKLNVTVKLAHRIVTNLGIKLTVIEHGHIL